MNELNLSYTKVVEEALGCKIYPDGKVVGVLSAGKEFPIRIDEKDLYMPYTEALNVNVDKRVFFHPACENILSKETEVFKLIRRLGVMRLLGVFRNMVETYFDAKRKRTHSQSVSDIIAPFESAKKSVRDEVFGIITRMTIEVGDDNLDNRLLHFKITKGGKSAKASGTRVYYKAKPIFPIYDLLIRAISQSEGQPKNHQVNFNNHSVSREALELVAHLIRTVIPAVNAPDDYEFESNIPIASRFTAFMLCFGELAEQINRAQTIFRAEFDKRSVYPIGLSWQESIEELPEYFRQVPELDYNSHNVYSETESGLSMDQQVDMASNLFSISRPQAVVQQTVTVAQTGYQTSSTGVPITVQQQPAGDSIRVVNGQQYTVTVPPMQHGDTYQRTEIDPHNNRVNHFAYDLNRMSVIYICTQMGSLLTRQTTQPQPVYGYNQPQQPQPPYVGVGGYGTGGVGYSYAPAPPPPSPMTPAF